MFLSDDDFNRDTSLVQGLIRVECHNLRALLAHTDELCCLGLYTRLESDRGFWRWQLALSIAPNRVGFT
jgi:hypothetical protein